MEKKLVNELSWSVSRAQLFRSCPRAYYHQYYGSWNGWSADCDEKTRLTYILRNIKTLPLWAGSIVHTIIKEALTAFQATRQPPSYEELKEKARALMNSQWIESRDGAWKNSPKKTNLFELYYGDGENYGTLRTLPREITDAIKERVLCCLDSFVHAPILKEILATPDSQWKTIDALDTFQLDDIKVWCAIDFAYEDAQGILHIIDWKTGTENRQTLSQQLACYALYASKKWGKSQKELALQGVFLLDGGRSSDYLVTPDLLASAERQIRTSYAAMKARLQNPETNEAQEEDFPPNPSDFNCGTCPFRQLCLNA